MYVFKDVLIKVTISLLVGLAGAIGTKIGSTLWDKVDNRDGKINQESFSN
jgi:hypothetical protein